MNELRQEVKEIKELISNHLTEVSGRLAKIETNISWLKKLAIISITSILGLFGTFLVNFFLR